MARHRMIISLDDDLHQIFKELSEVSDTPAATLAYQLLDASREQLKETIKAIRLARKGQSQAALLKMKEMVSDLSQDFDGAEKQLNEEIGKKK